MRGKLSLPVLVGAVTSCAVVAAAADESTCRSSTNLPDVAIKACSELIAVANITGIHQASNYVWRGRHFTRKADLDHAIADFTAAIKLTPGDADIHLRRGNAYRAKSLLDQAIADYSEAIRLSPSKADSYLGRGTANALKGRFDQAITDLTEAVRLAPRDATKYAGRGNAYRLQG